MYQSEYEFWEVFCLLLCSDDFKIALEVYAPCYQDLVDLDDKSLQQLGLHVFGVRALKRWLLTQEDVVIERKTVRKRKLSSMTVREASCSFRRLTTGTGP